MTKMSNWKYSINPEKSDLGFWRLILVNNETNQSEILQGWMNLRESYEYLRAFYKWRVCALRE